METKKGIVGTVSALWRYPVKSMDGERVERAFVSRRGVPGDRGWAVFDVARGGITTAKRLPPLRTCAARYDREQEPAPNQAPPAPKIQFPDGTRLASDSPEAARRLSALVGREVLVRALGATGETAAPRLTSEGESPEFVRGLFGLLPEEPMPDMSELPPERLRALRVGNYFDAFPLHLLTRTTLATLASVAPESDWDERRFRANIVIDAAEEKGYPEFEWISRRLRVGEVVLEAVMPCPRCAMVTQATPELPKDPGVMRTLVRETHHAAGVYAAIVEEGFVRVGDRLELV